MLKAQRQEKRPGPHQGSPGGETTEEEWLAVGQGLVPTTLQLRATIGVPLGPPAAQGSADALRLLFQPYPHLFVNHPNEADSVGMARKQRYYL